MQFFKALRERRLVQIVFSYVAFSWVVLSVFDQLVDRQVLPPVAYTVVLIWAVIGLPAAILIAWHHGEKGKQQAPMSEIAILIVLALTAVGFSGVKVKQDLHLKRQQEGQANPLELKKVAVLYFQDESPDSANQFLADGLTEGLIDELSRVPDITVISRNGAAEYRNSSLDTDSIPAIAEKLDVGTIVTGTVRPHGDKLKVTLEVLEGESGKELDSRTVEYPATDVIGLKTAIVSKTAELLREMIGKEVRTREAANGTTIVGAWTALQRAERARKDAETAIRNGDMQRASTLFASADSMLASAEKIDPAWIQPIVDRAALAYRQSRLAQRDPAAAVAFISTGIAHAERALQKSPHEGRALELRGTLNYYKFLLQVEPDPAKQQKLKDDARADLTAAVQYEPSLATAHATLSHMYSVDDVPTSIIEAQTAYTQDAYLEAAPVVLWRLFNGNYEQKSFTKADSWCREGNRRFPDDYRFVNCQLRMLNTPYIKPDSISIPKAWALLARQDSLTPDARKPFEHARGQMIVAGAIALKGERDSARAVLNRASTSVTSSVDPGGELVVVEAYIRALTGEHDRAIDLLSRAAAADPAQFEKDRKDIPWYWDGLRDEPRFRKLFGIN